MRTLSSPSCWLLTLMQGNPICSVQVCMTVVTGSPLAASSSAHSCGVSVLAYEYFVRYECMPLLKLASPIQS